MNASSNERHIPWFNPREMADSTVLALATGREELLQDFISFVRQRLENSILSTVGTHWLITGQRGTGKSFFLRYAQISVLKAFPKIRFILLPEELHNIRVPHDLLDEIHRMLTVAQGNQGRPAMWRTENPEKFWAESLEKLLGAFSEPLLIVGVENFDQLLKKAFTDEADISLLRKLMEHETRIMFLATAVDGSFDENYTNRFFHQFEKRLLTDWDGQAHRKYMEARACLLDRKPSRKQLVRIDAYSRYTGGNARIAAILATAILDEQDIVDASDDLNATIDRMSDYYRTRLDVLPETSGILFDALIRGGEPCSQTQLAKRVGVRQNDISRAFAKLLDVGYLHAHRAKRQKETRYKVADRLFVQWYRMRYLDPGQRSRLAVMVDLLADLIATKDKWHYVERFVGQGEYEDTQLMASQTLRNRNVADTTMKSLKEEKWLDLMEKYPSDADMLTAKEEALTLTKSYIGFNDEAYSGETLANFVLSSLGLGTQEKLIWLRTIPFISRSQWDQLVNILEEEKQNFAELAVLNEEYVQALKKKHTNAWQNPWLDGWRNIRHTMKIEYEQFSEGDYEIVKAALCAVEWLHRFRKNNELALQTWGELIHHIGKAREYGWKNELLQIHKQLLVALPKTACERAPLLTSQSSVFNKYDLQEEALQSAQKSLALITDQATATDEVRIDASQIAGLALGTLNRWSEALKSLQTTLPLTTGRNKAWHTGQTARYLWRLEGLAKAWDLIAAQNLEKDDLAYCIGQLGDGVCDAQRVDGTPQAYTAGRELLIDLIERAHDPVWSDKLLLKNAVRYLFLNMLDTGLDLSVLQDLAQDLPSFSPTDGELALLADTLYRWFGELRNPGTADNTSPPDPDWATTVAALNQELSFKSRLRLGLTKEPCLSTEASHIFTRILAFIK